ncbi:hypothetical protein [Kitasatospora sp. NPDC090091]|uniref:hypothetical protein n=1 Tax=Kitasatospora sp. NPDC090091 TaxID=3364081 RepID=UPI003829C689
MSDGQREGREAAAALDAALARIGFRLPTVEEYPWPVGPRPVPMVKIGLCPAKTISGLAAWINKHAD